MTTFDRRGPHEPPQDDDWAAHARNLGRLALALAGNRADADDLVQQTIANLLARRPDRALEPEYARRALVNAWLDRQRSVGRRLARMTARARVNPRHADDPDAIDEAEQRDLVRRAVAALPPKQHAALVLRTVEGLDDAAAAHALDCSREAVRANLHLARRALRAALGETP